MNDVQEAQENIQSAARIALLYDTNNNATAIPALADDNNELMSLVERVVADKGDDDNDSESKRNYLTMLQEKKMRSEKKIMKLRCLGNGKKIILITQTCLL